MSKILTIVRRDWKILLVSLGLATSLWYHIKTEVAEHGEIPREVPAFLKK